MSGTATDLPNNPRTVGTSLQVLGSRVWSDNWGYPRLSKRFTSDKKGSVSCHMITNVVLNNSKSYLGVLMYL